ncbi:hypothetical protein ABL78_4059 [Leptomonas seymouri]|uniref:Transcription factor Iwr1 domain-containing protein n=1 Tax=Leptomonas seymouri TaxID=5684 RepID=A0A0N0P5U4_LEPSE|nr:hypothetical protein ABL78_4059 [Leptomonas seymouri]|eukprot:KPI86869.1 hypothetical protein ABL78_4059 [Leptomonas seymouri]
MTMYRGVYACNTDPPVPRVYLKINCKRSRDSFFEDAPANQYVRVQWDAAEMGVPPPPLQGALAAGTKVLFRRLPNPAVKAAASDLDAVLAACDTSEDAITGNMHAEPVHTHVERVTQAGKCFLIECGGGEAERPTSPPAISLPAASALYVLDPRASEREAMEDAFGEFAITDEAPTECDTSKRKRVATDSIADVYLAPVRRLSLDQDHATAAQTEEAGAFISRWGPVEEDVTGATWKMLLGYDELLCVESAGEAATDLYCYPDHRKDDEYDSNAEDCSRNDYPNDVDEGSESRSGENGEGSESSTGRRLRHRHGNTAYGMFCEEGYSEYSLSSGWSDDDD